jgi:hypothetical protein
MPSPAVFAVAGSMLCNTGTGRDPISRHPGHHLHRLQGPGTPGHRGPGDLSADHCHAHRAEIKSGARLFLLRGLIRLLISRMAPTSWARSRVLEYLSAATQATKWRDSTLGPDATGVGWVYQYAFAVRTNRGDLRSRRIGPYDTVFPKPRAWQKWQASAASSNNTTSLSIQTA